MSDKPDRTDEFAVSDLLARRSRPEDFVPAARHAGTVVFVLLAVVGAIALGVVVQHLRDPEVASAPPAASTTLVLSGQPHPSDVGELDSAGALDLLPTPKAATKFDYLTPAQWLDVAVNAHRHVGRGIVVHGITRGNDGRVVLARVDAAGKADPKQYVVDVVIDATPAQLDQINVGERFNALVTVKGVLADSSCLPVLQLVDYQKHGAGAR